MIKNDSCKLVTWLGWPSLRGMLHIVGTFFLFLLVLLVAAHIMNSFFELLCNAFPECFELCQWARHVLITLWSADLPHGESLLRSFHFMCQMQFDRWSFCLTQHKLQSSAFNFRLVMKLPNGMLCFCIGICSGHKLHPQQVQGASLVSLSPYHNLVVLEAPQLMVLYTSNRACPPAVRKTAIFCSLELLLVQAAYTYKVKARLPVLRTLPQDQILLAVTAFLFSSALASKNRVFRHRLM